MTLPNPDRSSASMSSLGSTLGQLPAPPAQWQGADDAMRNWLAAKSEEDRRRQEEERTRQESLRLEQRKIEQSMLRDSLSGGIPPYMVPLVFVGMGGGNLANASLEWAQHYMAQFNLQHQQQQQQQAQQHIHTSQQLPHLPPSQTSPEVRRDARLLPGPTANPYAAQQPPSGSTQPTVHGAPPSGSSLVSFAPAYQIPPGASPADRSRAPPQQQQQQQASLSGTTLSSSGTSTAAGRSLTQQPLSRLNTSEMQIQPPPPSGAIPPAGTSGAAPTGGAGGGGTAQAESQSSPSMIFYHWIPPGASKDKEPPTPTGSTSIGASSRSHPHPPPSSHADSPHASSTSGPARSEYAHSPKKRKTNTSQPASVPPALASTVAAGAGRTPEPSPSLPPTAGSNRRRTHSRQRSDTSARGVQEALARTSVSGSSSRGSVADTRRDSSQAVQQHHQPQPPLHIQFHHQQSHAQHLPSQQQHHTAESSASEGDAASQRHASTQPETGASRSGRPGSASFDSSAA